jgi:hypothetical protein
MVSSVYGRWEIVMATTYIGTVREGKIELDEPLTLPEGSQVQVTPLMRLDEQAARRRADRWLEDNVGNIVTARSSRLIQFDNIEIWQFEAFITGPHIEPIGPIGHVEVEALTGQILTTSERTEEMIVRGATLTPILQILS